MGPGGYDYFAGSSSGMLASQTVGPMEHQTSQSASAILMHDSSGAGNIPLRTHSMESLVSGRTSTSQQEQDQQRRRPIAESPLVTHVVGTPPGTKLTSFSSYHHV